MTLEDIKKLATGSLLFSLNRIISPRLINILYFLGLATIVLWAISHFFATFSYGFGSGLWGLLEIAVFGLLGFVVLRIACEAIIVFFRANEKFADVAPSSKGNNTLIDEVRDAIEELAEEDDEPVALQAPKASVSSKSTSSRAAASKPAATKAKSPRRTAKRTPPAKKS